MTTFTASEVRDWERAYKGTGAAKVFDAFADMLEAREKAVPVMVVNHVSSAEHDLPIGMKLYTHPSPSVAHNAQAQPPAASVPDAMQELADKYHELLWAVARKFSGETRHETALRYIREAECQEAALAAQENPNG